MLLELRVENYAVIDNVVVEFAPGLNLLTGETGAGKSILIDALALLLGEKANSDVVRHGAEKAVVSGVFEVDSGKLAAVLGENGIDNDGGQLIIRRDIAAGGKGRVFINNQPATVTVLKQLAPLIGVIHAQNETMLAFDAAERLALLDIAAGAEREPTERAFADWKAIQAKIKEMETGEQERLRLVDLWKFQLKEIDEARLQSGEDQKLEAEKRVLANSERIFAAAMGAFDLLYEANHSAAASMRGAGKHLEELARFDPKFQESVAALDSARITVEDIGSTLRDYADGIEASPDRLAEIEDRLALLDRLRRKYGHTVDEVIAYGEELRRKLQEVENKDEVLAQLQKDLNAASERYLSAARTLSRRRYEAARKLEKIVEEEINDLAMKARFRIDVSGSDEPGNWSPSGFDHVTYLISANPGEPMGPIEQIASGGELSRVMLALKASIEAGRTVSKRVDAAHQRTLVFDEIDTGIGGRAAEAVGKKLKSLSRTKQLLCITHLPQIASFADHHYVIEKREAGGRTKTAVRVLNAQERTQEIARMLSGAKLTDTSLKHAEQMLKTNA